MRVMRSVVGVLREAGMAVQLIKMGEQWQCSDVVEGVVQQDFYNRIYRLRLPIFKTYRCTTRT